LWFEHDPYDQLILIFLLSFYHRSGLPKILWIVSTDKFPGAVRFRGLGLLPPEAIRLLWKTKQQVTPEQCLEADQHWKAFTDPDKSTFHEYIKSLSNSTFPYFRSAAFRYMQEKPIAEDQLPLTQVITIKILTEKSPQQAGVLFKRVGEVEDPLPFLGDIMYWQILRQMRDDCLLDFSDESAHWGETLIHLK
jgi:hypothetical protein